MASSSLEASPARFNRDTLLEPGVTRHLFDVLYDAATRVNEDRIRCAQEALRVRMQMETEQLRTGTHGQLRLGQLSRMLADLMQFTTPAPCHELADHIFGGFYAAMNEQRESFDNALAQQKEALAQQKEAFEGEVLELRIRLSVIEHELWPRDKSCSAPVGGGGSSSHVHPSECIHAAPGQVLAGWEVTELREGNEEEKRMPTGHSHSASSPPPYSLSRTPLQPLDIANVGESASGVSPQQAPQPFFSADTARSGSVSATSGSCASPASISPPTSNSSSPQSAASSSPTTPQAPVSRSSLSRNTSPDSGSTFSSDSGSTSSASSSVGDKRRAPEAFGGDGDNMQECDIRNEALHAVDIKTTLQREGDAVHRWKAKPDGDMPLRCALCDSSIEWILLYLKNERAEAGSVHLDNGGLCAHWMVCRSTKCSPGMTMEQMRDNAEVALRLVLKPWECIKEERRSQTKPEMGNVHSEMVRSLGSAAPDDARALRCTHHFSCSSPRHGSTWSLFTNRKEHRRGKRQKIAQNGEDIAVRMFMCRCFLPECKRLRELFGGRFEPGFMLSIVLTRDEGFVVSAWRDHPNTVARRPVTDRPLLVLNLPSVPKAENVPSVLVVHDGIVRVLIVSRARVGQALVDSNSENVCCTAVSFLRAGQKAHGRVVQSGQVSKTTPVGFCKAIFRPFDPLEELEKAQAEVNNDEQRRVLDGQLEQMRERVDRFAKELQKAREQNKAIEKQMTTVVEARARGGVQSGASVSYAALATTRDPPPSGTASSASEDIFGVLDYSSDDEEEAGESSGEISQDAGGVQNALENGDSEQLSVFERIYSETDALRPKVDEVVDASRALLDELPTPLSEYAVVCYVRLVQTKLDRMLNGMAPEPIEHVMRRLLGDECQEVHPFAVGMLFEAIPHDDVHAAPQQLAIAREMGEPARLFVSDRTDWVRQVAVVVLHTPASINLINRTRPSRMTAGGALEEGTEPPPMLVEMAVRRGQGRLSNPATRDEEFKLEQLQLVASTRCYVYLPRYEGLQYAQGGESGADPMLAKNCMALLWERIQRESGAALSCPEPSGFTHADEDVLWKTGILHGGPHGDREDGADESVPDESHSPSPSLSPLRSPPSSPSHSPSPSSSPSRLSLSSPSPTAPPPGMIEREVHEDAAEAGAVDSDEDDGAAQEPFLLFEQAMELRDGPLQDGEMWGDRKRRAAKLFEKADGKMWGDRKRRAAKLFEKAAEAGYAPAKAWAAYCSLLLYEGGEMEHEAAVEWTRQASTAGDPFGTAVLAWAYLCGRGVTKDRKKGYRLARESAEAGDAFGQWVLGNCFQWGWGVGQSWAEAVEWYGKAAEQGHPWGLNNFGRCHDTGNGVPENEEEAFKWQLEAAEKGNAVAQYNVGVYHEHGLGGAKKDKELAMAWYKQAADQGEPKAAAKLRGLTSITSGGFWAWFSK
eukprot:TRINITY_DN1651_c0_g1_i16.p1 TRINITY_DN1651_c0_g1~~TRINITY_DN1651_c0_g1_i16.p1  ORF type:complete len:1436 (-),score=250.52 TRINITY_DN1651_c0_g1_i16:49-4356(-)